MTVQEDKLKQVKELHRVLDVDESRLTPCELGQLQELVEDYYDLFVMDDFELGVTNAASHAIDTGDHPPIRQLP